MTEKPFLGKRYSRVSSVHDYLLEPVRTEARQRIMKEILEKAQKHEVSCLCGNPDKDVPLAQMDRWGLPCTTVLCSHCGMIRVNPRFGGNVYGEIYAELYWPMAMGSLEISQSRFDLSVRRASEYAGYLTRHYNLAGKEILELGCSHGAGLQVLKHSGAGLTGYDYDQRMLDYGRRFTSLDLRYGGALEAVKDGNRYDLIILRHVFEHMLNPHAEFSSLKELLKPEGALFVEVPGILNPQWWKPDPYFYFDVFHAYCYCLNHLDCLMRTNGFRLLHGDEHVFSLWRLGPEDKNVQWQNPALVKRILGHLTAMERARKLNAIRSGIVGIPGKILSYFRRH